MRRVTDWPRLHVTRVSQFRVCVCVRKWPPGKRPLVCDWFHQTLHCVCKLSCSYPKCKVMAKIVFTKPPANCRSRKEEYGAEFLAQTGSPWFLFPEEVLSSPVLPKAKEFIFLHAALFLVPPHSLCKRIATVPEVPVYGHFLSDDNCGHCRWPAPVNRDCCVCGKDPSLSVVLTFPADKPSVPSVLLPSRCPKRLPGILVMLCWLCPCGAPAAVVTVPQACARSKFLSVYRTLAR